MRGARGICKECGEEFFTDSENCGTDESLCDECYNLFLEQQNENSQPEDSADKPCKCLAMNNPEANKNGKCEICGGNRR